MMTSLNFLCFERNQRNQRFSRRTFHADPTIMAWSEMLKPLEAQDKTKRRGSRDQPHMKKITRAASMADIKLIPSYGKLSTQDLCVRVLGARG